MRPKAQRAGQGTAYAKTGGGSPPLQLDAAELSQDLASRHEPLRKVMPMTVLRHRGRPRGEAPEAFDLRRNGWKPDLPARCQRSNRTALPTTNYPTTPTRNRNVPKYPLREKPQIRKAGEPLQLDREDLRLVDQIQLKLQRGNLVRDGAVVRLRPGNVVVRVAVLDGSAAAAEVPVSQPLFGLP